MNNKFFFLLFADFRQVVILGNFADFVLNKNYKIFTSLGLVKFMINFTKVEVSQRYKSFLYTLGKSKLYIILQTWKKSRLWVYFTDLRQNENNIHY